MYIARIFLHIRVYGHALHQLAVCMHEHLVSSWLAMETPANWQGREVESGVLGTRRGEKRIILNTNHVMQVWIHLLLKKKTSKQPIQS